MILYSFIGLALNIWRATKGTGGGLTPNGALIQRDNSFILDRNNNYILNISQS